MSSEQHGVVLNRTFTRKVKNLHDVTAEDKVALNIPEQEH